MPRLCSSRPLLVSGEPRHLRGLCAGNRRIAAICSNALLIEWHVRVDHQGNCRPVRIRRGLAPARQPACDARVADIRNHQAWQMAWMACRQADERPVLLIDGIDKADIELPNDLLQEPRRFCMEFFFATKASETVQLRRAAARSSSSRRNVIQKGIAGFVPAPLLFPLQSRFPDPRHHDGDHRSVFSRGISSGLVAEAPAKLASRDP